MQKQCTIAIAEDHHMFREMLRLSLLNAGYRILASASNGRELLKLLEQSRESPDICLTDLNMPILDGYELVPLLKSSYPCTTIVVYSSSDEQAVRNEMRKLGADSFISKAGRVEDFFDAIKQLADTRLRQRNNFNAE